MEIEIKRIRKRDFAIDGMLYIAGQQVCDTAENAQHCIPAGTYPVIVKTCKQYRRKMPVVLLLVKGVDCMCCKKLDCVSNNTTLPCYCPQIKIGNGVCHRTDGSIIIGERVVTGCIKHPAKHFNRLIDRLDKAASRGEEITLTIA